jgi:hypothetical protein
VEYSGLNFFFGSITRFNTEQHRASERFVSEYDSG